MIDISLNFSKISIAIDFFNNEIHLYRHIRAENTPFRRRKRQYVFIIEVHRSADYRINHLSSASFTSHPFEDEPDVPSSNGAFSPVHILS